MRTVHARPSLGFHDDILVVGGVHGDHQLPPEDESAGVYCEHS